MKRLRHPGLLRTLAMASVPGSVASAAAVAQNASAPPHAVRSLSWLSGCWLQSQPDGVVEEHWTQPSGGTLVGMGRTVRAGRTSEYAFLLIKPIDGRLAYIATPSGQPEATFTAKTLSDREVVFENLAHDCPQRVIYRRNGDAALSARVEGTLPSGQSRGVDVSYVRCK